MEKRAERESKISGEVLSRVEELAMLRLTEQEREQIRSELGRMLAYVNRLQEVDTDGVEPLVQTLPEENVFREDIETGENQCEAILSSAPESEDGMWTVPQTVQTPDDRRQ